MLEAERRKPAAGAGGAGTAILCREVHQTKGKVMPIRLGA